jgi:predicted O-methyltransferase YrrM
MTVININTTTDYTQFITKKCSGFGLGALLANVDNPVGVEIGCADADTTFFLLSTHPTLKLTSIDPYVNYIDWNGNNLNSLQKSYEFVTEKLRPFGDRFTLLRDYSDNVVNQFEDESLDFIFIDGLHTYDQVKKDCMNYWPKIKSGGLFAGHDYSVIPAVNKAVNEFAGSINMKIKTTEIDVWYWYK